MRYGILLFFLFATPFVYGTQSKTQKVNFNEVDIEGRGRKPDGAYLVQKKGIRFMPLYKVKKKLTEKVHKSSDYLRNL